MPNCNSCRVIVVKNIDNKGFTLLELIVVCALIGIMLVVSVPALRNTLLEDQLKTTSRRMIGFINGVRELAVREHHAYVIHFNRTENTLWYEKDQHTDNKEKLMDRQSFTLSDDVRISEIWTRSKGVFPLNLDKIWVSRKGYMDQLILHLTDVQENVMSLHFSPFLQTVTVYDTYTPES